MINRRLAGPTDLGKRNTSLSIALELTVPMRIFSSRRIFLNSIFPNASSTSTTLAASARLGVET